MATSSAARRRATIAETDQRFLTTGLRSIECWACTDAKLVEAARNGDVSGFGELYRRHYAAAVGDRLLRDCRTITWPRTPPRRRLPWPAAICGVCGVPRNSPRGCTQSAAKVARRLAQIEIAMSLADGDCLGSGRTA